MRVAVSFSRRQEFSSCGIYGGRSSTGTGYLRVLLFPLLIFIPPNVPLLSSVTRRMGHSSGLSTSRLNLTPPSGE